MGQAKQSCFSLLCGLLRSQTFPLSGLGPYHCVSFLSRAPAQAGLVLGGSSPSYWAPMFMNLTRALTLCVLRQQKDLASTYQLWGRKGPGQELGGPNPTNCLSYAEPYWGNPEQTDHRPCRHRPIACSLHLGWWGGDKGRWKTPLQPHHLGAPFYGCCRDWGPERGNDLPKSPEYLDDYLTSGNHRWLKYESFY